MAFSHTLRWWKTVFNKITFISEFGSITNNLRSITRVQLLKPNSPDKLASFQDKSYYDVTTRDVIIPSKQTTYWCSVQKLPELFDEQVNIVGFDKTSSNESLHLFHHMEVCWKGYTPFDRRPSTEKKVEEYLLLIAKQTVRTLTLTRTGYCDD